MRLLTETLVTVTDHGSEMGYSVRYQFDALTGDMVTWRTWLWRHDWIDDLAAGMRAEKPWTRTLVREIGVN
jgi:hypothetical protein